jgi:Fe-S-cluster containining protein
LGSKKNRNKKAARARKKRETALSVDVNVDMPANVQAGVNGDLLQNLIGLVENSNRLASDEVQKDIESIPPQFPIACKEGCAWCCYLRVDVAAPEVFRIVAYVRASLREDEIDSLRNRVVEANDATRGLSPDARFALSLPCPLLVNDRCSVYSVRPMACRGMNSFDARECENAWRNPRSLPVIPQYPVLVLNYSSFLQALCDSLNIAGVDGNPLELNAALRIALETPDVIDRWMAGEAVFARAGV